MSDDHDAPPLSPSDSHEVASPDEILPVTDTALLGWARQFIEELAGGQHAGLHSLEHEPFERHVALAQVVPEKLRDRRAAVRRAAAWVAGAADVHDEETVPLLIRLIRDQSPLTRMAGAWACREIGADAAEAVPALAAALEDSDGGVRFAAAYGLQGIGPAAAPAVPALLAVAEAGGPGHLRAAVVRALADIAPDAPAVRELMLRGLGDPDGRLTFFATCGVARAEAVPAEAVTRLVTNLASADPYLLTVTAWAVGRATGDPEGGAAPALLTALGRAHWMQIEHNELPIEESVSIRPDLADALVPHLSVTDDADYEDFRRRFFRHAFHPTPTAETAWVDALVSHPWYLKVQRRRFGHPSSAAERATIRELVTEAKARFATRLWKNPTLGLTPAAHALLPGFIKNHCRNIAWRLRRRVGERAGQSGGDMREAADPQAGSVGAADVWEVLETHLPADEREAARLVWFVGHSIGEAAALLNLTPSQVKTRLANARARLAPRLR